SSGVQAGNFAINTADLPNDGKNGASPAIGVAIGSSSGFGTATIKVLLGPVPTGNSAIDDVAASAIGGPNPPTMPQYTSNGSATAPTRVLVSGNWFTINSAAPVVTLSPTSVDFGTQVIGVPGNGRSVLIINTS